MAISYQIISIVALVLITPKPSIIVGTKWEVIVRLKKINSDNKIIKNKL